MTTFRRMKKPLMSLLATGFVIRMRLTGTWILQRETVPNPYLVLRVVSPHYVMELNLRQCFPAMPTPKSSHHSAMHPSQGRAVSAVQWELLRDHQISIKTMPSPPTIADLKSGRAFSVHWKLKGHQVTTETMPSHPTVMDLQLRRALFAAQ